MQVEVAPLDSTVTEEDLLKLDEAVQTVTARRRGLPERLTLYLTRALHHRKETEAVITAQVRGINAVESNLAGNETLGFYPICPHCGHRYP